MKIILYVTLLACLALTCAAARKNWALLIAGSAGYDNYRHQADICHAYQIFHKAGIPDEQIVVMMYDDIANNTENPFKGNIINRPKGPNVYPGVPKDYTGSEVSAKMFLAVLQGDKDEVKKLSGRAGKVVDSGPEDYVFVYFADHGAPGILGMPTPQYLKAKDVNKALKKMHQQNRYAELVFYVEACESGSIFQTLLPDNINVYATTAANSEESSYACYYDSSRNTYLGDTYSVKWMEHTDKANLQTETFEQQYKKIKKETHSSHVKQFGDMKISQDVLDKFFGNDKVRPDVNMTRDIKGSSEPSAEVPSEMVAVQILKNRIMDSQVNTEARTELERQLARLQNTLTMTHSLIWDIATTVYSGLSERTVYSRAMRDHETIAQWDCYYTVVDTLLGFCPGLDITKNDFALRKFYVLVNLCNHNPVGKVIAATEAAAAVNPLCRL